MNTNMVGVSFKIVYGIVNQQCLDAIVEEEAISLSEIGNHVRSQDFSSNAEIIVSSGGLASNTKRIRCLS